MSFENLWKLLAESFLAEVCEFVFFFHFLWCEHFNRKLQTLSLHVGVKLEQTP